MEVATSVAETGTVRLFDHALCGCAVTKSNLAEHDDVFCRSRESDYA
jgi:hypothetical protein